MATSSYPHAALSALAGCDMGSLRSGEAPQIAGSLKRVRGWLDSFEAEFTNHLTALYESGVGAPASDLHTRNQGCSAREARAKERRAKALADAKTFNDALADGAIGAEHADVLANATGKLDKDLKDEFFGHEGSLLDEAKHSIARTVRPSLPITTRPVEA